MTKILPCRFKQSFGPFNMLSVHKCPDTGLFTYLSNLLFPVYNLRNKSPMSVIYFSKYCKFYVHSKNAAKSLEIVCSFWDNCISIAGVRHSVFLRENTCHRVGISYENVSRFEILLKQIFSTWHPLKMIKKYEKNTAVQIQAIIRSLKHVDCP